MKLQDLLRHIADNVESGRDKGAYLFYKGGKFQGGLPDLSQHEHFSLAPCTHEVNGFTVPAPEVEVLARGDVYFIGEASSVDWYTEYTWYEDNSDKRFLERGLVHLTRGAAIVNAKAMLGIDPYSEVEE